MAKKLFAIIAMVIGVALIPLGGWLATTLTQLQVQAGVTNQRLAAIDQRLESIEDRLKSLEAWQIDHLQGHVVDNPESSRDSAAAE